MNSGSKPILLGAASLIAPAIAHPAQAAEQAPQQADLGSFAVTDTVVVSGSYKTERQSSPKATADLVDTPRSITVITRQLLEDTSSTTLADALRTVPGITLGAGEGGNPLGDRPFIRGSDSSNSIYLDGVRDIAATSRETFAVESIEITKGSDGITNGSGNAGGSINIISKSPEKRRFIHADATYGTKGYTRFTVDLNQPINDFIGLRVAGMYHDQGVAGRDYAWQRRWGIAPSLKIGMTGPTSLTLDWYHMQSSELPDQGIPYTRIASSFTAPGYYEVAPLSTDPFATANGGTVQRQRGTFYGLVNRDFRTTNNDAFTARFEHQVSDDLKLRNTFRYSNTEQDYLWTLPDDSRGNLYNYGTISRRVNARYSKQDGLVDQLDLSGKFNTGGIRHSFATGLEFNWQKAAIGNYLSDASGTAVALAIACPTATTGTNGICTSASNPNPFDAFTTPIIKGPNNSQSISDWTTLSAYVFDTVTLSDKWLLNLGGRYDRYLTHASAAVATPYTGTRTWQRRVDDLFTYQAGLVYKPRPNGSFYISTATSAIAPGSFLAQGSEDNAVASATIDPNSLKVQKSTTYEAGTKWNLFHENLSVSLAVFQTRTTNARVTSDNGTVTFIGDKRVRGIELGISGNVTDKWSLFGGWSHMPSVLLNSGYTSVGGVYVPSANTGKRAPNTPLDSLTLNTTYKITPKITLGGGAIYMSKVYGGYGYGSTASVVRAVYVPSYWRFDANAAYQLTDKVAVKVSALNLTNKLYYDQAYASHYAHQAAGRTILASLSVKY